MYTYIYIYNVLHHVNVNLNYKRDAGKVEFADTTKAFPSYQIKTRQDSSAQLWGSQGLEAADHMTGWPSGCCGELFILSKLTRSRDRQEMAEGELWNSHISQNDLLKLKHSVNMLILLTISLLTTLIFNKCTYSCSPSSLQLLTFPDLGHEIWTEQFLPGFSELVNWSFAVAN